MRGKYNVIYVSVGTRNVMKDIEILIQTSQQIPDNLLRFCAPFCPAFYFGALFKSCFGKVWKNSDQDH